ncbi:hypothetical protein [Stutzerimonas nitrititolerans]|uniref:hypothetical protein n=1 Tax=Stutzerimonas nitrititolerans TaxID=2482751 RepID=UPI0028A1D989|nr:hypothetical protein [Stutzerimonas nitrititolerans]
MSFEALLSLTDPVVIAASALAITSYAVAVSKMLNRITGRRENEEKQFIKVISPSIKSKIITDFSDIENIYKGVRSSLSYDDTDKARLAKWLRKYLLQVLKQETNEKNTDLIKTIKNEISEHIKEVEKASPHAALPELERSIVRDIETYLFADNKESVNRKLNELVTTIQVREEAFRKIENTNKWAVPLSVIGLILTVIFGVMSLLGSSA